MKRSEQFDQVTKAFFAAKAIINALPLVKDKAGDKGRYLQLPTLLAAIEPVLLAEGLLVTQGTVEKVTDGVLIAITLETTLLHMSGQWISQEIIIPVRGQAISKEKGGGFAQVGPQDGGVSTTYARRYGIYAFFSISVDEDTDGAAKNQGRRQRAKQIAENIIDGTARRTAELKDKVSKLVTAPEGCPTCKSAQGTPHKKKCTDG